jgi:hypothetical protein
MSWTQGIGRVVDLSVGIVPTDMSSAANTGKRVSMKNCSAITVVLFKKAGTAGDDPAFTLNQHTAASSGSSGTLAKIDTVYSKLAATPDGTETWTKTTQAAAATYTDATSAEAGGVIAFTIGADQLSDGYSYISVDVADVGSNAQIGGLLYILHDLNVRRAPASLPAALS